jgi:hypothetical protein
LQFGHDPPKGGVDQAHIYQIAMLLHLPLILLFAVSAPNGFKQEWPVLGAQIGMFALALVALRTSGL